MEGGDLGHKERGAPSDDPIRQEAAGKKRREDGMLLQPRPIERVIGIVRWLWDENYLPIFGRLQIGRKFLAATFLDVLFGDFLVDNVDAGATIELLSGDEL